MRRAVQAESPPNVPYARGLPGHRAKDGPARERGRGLLRCPLTLCCARRPEHFIFLGDCYIEDDELMWGDVCKRVRSRRGGGASPIYM